MASLRKIFKFAWKWLGVGHNFTCKTLVLISNALGEKIIQVV